MLSEVGWGMGITMLVFGIVKVQQSDAFTFMSAYGVSVEFTVISCKETRFRGFHAHLRATSGNKYHSWTVVFASDEPIHRWLYPKQSYPRFRNFPHKRDSTCQLAVTVSRVE